jgi:hypothetical protein
VVAERLDPEPEAEASQLVEKPERTDILGPFHSDDSVGQWQIVKEVLPYAALTDMRAPAWVMARASQ